MHITDQKLYNNFDLMLKVQILAEWKVLPHHEKIVKFIVYLTDWLATKYKVNHNVQERTLSLRKKKYQAEKDRAAKEEADKAKEKEKKSK